MAAFTMKDLGSAADAVEKMPDAFNSFQVIKCNRLGLRFMTEQFLEFFVVAFLFGFDGLDC